MSNEVFPLSAVGAKILSREIVAGVQVDQGASGKEARHSYQNSFATRYKVAVSIVRPDTRLDFQQFLSHFARHFGGLQSFLIRDEEDYTVTDHGFGVGDGATTGFQLQRNMLGSVSDRGTGGPYAVSSKPRTNLCLRSQEFDDASWTKYFATVTANAVVAPDGTKTADKLIEDTTPTTVHGARASPVLVSGVAYVFSVWVKAAGRTSVWLSNPVGNVTFDLSAGTVGTPSAGVTGAITACSGGWYRCELRFTSASTGTVVQDILPISGSTATYTGDGASGLYLWGAQVEAAATATRYIATTSAALTSSPSYWPAYADGFEVVDEPDLSTILVYKDSALQTRVDSPPAAGQYSVGATGAVTFGTAPGAATVLSWTGNYYRRVRFEGAGMVQERIGSRMWAIPTIDLVSVRSVT